MSSSHFFSTPANSFVCVCVCLSIDTPHVCLSRVQVSLMRRYCTSTPYGMLRRVLTGPSRCLPHTHPPGTQWRCQTIVLLARPCDKIPPQHLSEWESQRGRARSDRPETEPKRSARNETGDNGISANFR